MRSALLIIDGTQSIGSMPFDLDEIKPDALVCAGYKWLMGPYGSVYLTMVLILIMENR